MLKSQSLENENDNNEHNERLQEQLVYVYQNSPFYRNIILKNKIDIQNIRSVQDLSIFPITEKADLQAHWKEMIACNSEEIADYSTTSGTSGKPVTVPISQSDLKRLAQNEAYSFQKMELNSSDIIQLCTATDRSFMAGLAYMMGAHLLKIPLVRTGAGMPEMQWERMLTLGVTTLVAVPSFVVKLIEYAENEQVDLSSLKLKKILCIGEAIRNESFDFNALGKRIIEKLPGVQLFSTYASTEMQTAFTECKNGNGAHLNPDLMLVEFLDENNVPVQEGEIGELTITNLGVTGMPLIRFKTGDLCKFYTTPCTCGDNSLRVGPILGRKQQMIKFKGTTLFPAAIQEVIDTYEEIADAITVLNSDEFGNDLISVYVTLKNDNNNAFDKKLKNSFKSRLRVTPEVIISNKVLIETLRSSVPSRKLVKLVDLRNKN